MVAEMVSALQTRVATTNPSGWAYRRRNLQAGATESGVATLVARCLTSRRG